MPLPIIHPIALDTLTVLLVAPLTESLSIDEQAIVGAFLSTMGDMLSLNSSYLSYIYSKQDGADQDNMAEENQNSDEYELLKKSIDKIKEELEKIKQDDCKPFKNSLI